MNDLSQSPISAVSFEPQKWVLAEIPVEKIVVPDQLFDVECCNNKAEQVYFPLVVVPDGDLYRIIDGCKRFVGLSKKNVSTCICYVINQAYCEKNAGLLRIQLNKSRRFELREKIVLSCWLKGKFDKDQYDSALLELGINKHEKQNIELLQNASSKIVMAVETGKLDIGLVADFFVLDKNDAEAVLEFFMEFSFTRQAQKELLEWLPELAYRNKCSVKTILENGEIVKISENEALNAPQKMDKIRNLIFTMRFPNLVSARENWKKLEKQVNPDPLRVQFKPSEAFEKNRLEIKITASDSKKLKETIGKLNLLDENTWRTLIYPLNDQ